MRCVDALERSKSSAPVDLRQFLDGVPEEHRRERSAGAGLRRIRAAAGGVGSGRRPRSIWKNIPSCATRATAVTELLKAEFALRQAAGENPSLDEFRRIDPEFEPSATTDEGTSALVTKALNGSDVCLASTHTPISAPPPAPERLEKYTIVRQLVAGGFGVVYEAYDEQLERTVAIKIRHGHDGQSGLSDDLLHEARSIAQLDHPNIVRLLEAGETPQGLGLRRLRVRRRRNAGSEISIATTTTVPKRSSGWRRSPRPCTTLTSGGSSIATSSRPTSCSTRPRRPKVVDFGLARRNDQFFTNESGQIVGTVWPTSVPNRPTAIRIGPARSRICIRWVSCCMSCCASGGRFRRRAPARCSTRYCIGIPRRRAASTTRFPPRWKTPASRPWPKQPAERFKTGNDMASARACRDAAAQVAARSWRATRPRLVGRGGAVPARRLAADARAAVSRAESARNQRLQSVVGRYRNPGQQPPAARTAAPTEGRGEFHRAGLRLSVRLRAAGRRPLDLAGSSKLAEQHPISQLIYPPLAGDAMPLLVPDADGATFVVVLASHEPLTARRWPNCWHEAAR